jgi:hypothetical protein
MQRKTSLEKRVRKEKLRTGTAIMDKKISNTIKEVNKQSKKRVLVALKPPLKTYDQECYEDMFTFVTTPISPEYLTKCAIEWVNMTYNNDDILFMNEYRMQKGIPQTTWEDWVNRSSKLKSAQSFVREIIAMRREKGGLLNKYNSAMVMKIQCVYSKEWKETEEWRSSLAAKNDTHQTQPIQVILENYPNSPLVPPKKTEE